MSAKPEMTASNAMKGHAMSRMKLVMAAAIAAAVVQLLCVHPADAATPAAGATDDAAPKPPIKHAGPDDLAPRTAIVVQDNVAMRAAAKDSAPAQAQLWRGEALEIRGERPDHFQVYDYRRERGGFVRKSALLPLSGPAAQPESLLAALRVVRQQPGMEALGLGLAAAYVQAASAARINGPEGAEALDAMGTLAERLAERASRATPRPDGALTSADAQVAAQLDVAARYGLRFRTLEREGGAMQLCYDGEAFRRVLAMAAATPEQKARAALALTRTDCLDPAATPAQREPMDQWRADVLDKVELGDPLLATFWRNRVLMRQTGVWSSLAFLRARRASAPAQLQVDAASAAARRALEAFARVVPAELSDDDQPSYNDAAMRGNAMRWLALPAGPSEQSIGGFRLSAAAGPAGETCLTLTLNGAREGSAALLRHCGWGLLMTASARINREGNAIAIASMPVDGWRELWLLRRAPQGWRVTVLPPVAAQPGLGYAEFAGWVPGGKEALVARESRAEGRYKRSYELVDLDTLETKRQAGDAALLGAFQRWQAADWRGATLSLR